MEDRKKVLSEEYGLVMDDDMEEAMKKMCNLSDVVFMAGEAKGEATGEARGEAKGKIIGADNLADLLTQLYAEGKDEIAQKLISDKSYRDQVLGGVVSV